MGGSFLWEKNAKLVLAPSVVAHQRRKSVVRVAIKKIVPKLSDDMGLKPSKQTPTVPPNVHFSNCFPSSNAFSNTFPNAQCDLKT